MPTTAADPLTPALAVSRIARQRLTRLAARLPKRRRAEFLARTRATLAEIEPLLARALRDAQLLAWVDAARTQVQAAAVSPQETLRPPPGGPPPAPLFPAAPGDPPPVVKFPQIESAARYLQTRIDLTPTDFARLDYGARQTAFTVARAQTVDAVRAVREAVEADVRDGGTLKQFRAKVNAALGESALAPAQVESLYRTHTARAYSAGQIEVLDHPLVGDEFPYLEYSATHDGRVRPEHLAMEKLGLNGTAVYRRDDPIWDKFYPPWGWNCRCVVIPLSIEDAAARGVKEAIRWRDTGRPPTAPQYVSPPPFDLPKGWVPTGRGLSAVL